MICFQKKKQKKVGFEDQPAPTVESALELLEDLFVKHAINFDKELLSSQSLESDSNEDMPSKSTKSIRKVEVRCLVELQALIAKMISDSLPGIVDQAFEGSDEVDPKENIRVLTVLYCLLSTTVIKENNSCKMLRWIYDLTNQSFCLCLEFRTIIEATKNKLLKVGFLILSQYQHVNCKDIDHTDEPAFKHLVANLIANKEKKVSSMQYEICRVCECFFPLDSIDFHLDECERIHQIKYNEARLDEKGAELLVLMKELEEDENDNELASIRELFKRMFFSFDGTIAMFQLKFNLEEIKDILNDFELCPPRADLLELVQVLKTYHQLRLKDTEVESFSDKDSKGMKHKKIVSIRGLANSSTTSLDHDSPTMPASTQSYKSINSEEVPHSRSGTSVVCLTDFEVLEKIGKGSYSEVFLVRKRKTKDLFAMKVMEIEDLNEDRMQAFKKEQKIYRSIGGVYNVNLYYSFKEDNLYFFILDFGSGGTFRTLIQDEVYLQEKDARVYMANLVLALESLHSMDIIHRDLKPDNIVISDQGHLILTDFNLCKLIKEKELMKPNSFYGTPDYISPEVLNGQPATQAFDWFSLGIIAYEMIVGVTPFADNTIQYVFDNILKNEIEWPEVGTDDDQISPNCKDLIQKLLNPDPLQRLGSNGLDQIKNHKFFQGINWSNLDQLEYFFIPQRVVSDTENQQLLETIESRRRKVSVEFITEEAIVRYDVLKESTSNKVRSRRSSRFKLEKELEDLKFDGQGNLRKQKSSSDFRLQEKDSLRFSCRDFSNKQIVEE